MTPQKTIIQARATTPRAAAIAGILFSILLLTSLVLIRISVPPDPQDAGIWLAGNWKNVNLALNLLPFAGIAFLWFIGVVRDRLGEHEDRLFATVFLGSGLLFLAMLFASAGIAGGIISLYGVTPGMLIEFRPVQFRSHGNLRDYERLYDEDGRCVHALNLHPIAAHRDFPALDGCPGPGVGAVSAPEHWLLLLGSAGIPAVGASDQRIHPGGRICRNRKVSLQQQPHKELYRVKEFFI